MCKCRGVSSPPSADVLAEFGVTGDPQPLAGGQRTVWRVGDMVLKRLDGSAQTVAWQSDVLEKVRPWAGVRVAPPLPSVSGGWVVQEWTAWHFVAGKPAWGNWRTIMAAGHALHEAVRDEPRPPFLADRDDVWARADRTVWDLTAAPPRAELATAFDARRPVDLQDQLVHGDLTGNVLIHGRAAPAVIDFSPYWRPAAWATAVVCADAVLFAHADLDAVLTAARRATGEAPCGQVLLRAVLFRLVTATPLDGPGNDPIRSRVLDRVVPIALSGS